MSEHKEPWRIEKKDDALFVLDSEDRIVFDVLDCQAEEDCMRRIVACVNFLAGIETETLVSGEWKSALMASKPYIRPAFSIDLEGGESDG